MTRKLAQVRNMAFLESVLLKIAQGGLLAGALSKIVGKGLLGKALPAASPFTLAAGRLPPPLLNATQRLASKLPAMAPAQRGALQGMTTMVDAVRPPAWARF